LPSLDSKTVPLLFFSAAADLRLSSIHNLFKYLYFCLDYQREIGYSSKIQLNKKQIYYKFYKKSRNLEMTV